MASYSRRDQWLAGCSMTLSIAAIAGLLFLSTIEDARVRTELVRLVSKLSPVLDQRLLDRVTAAIEHFPTHTACGEKERTGCVAAAADPAESPMSNGSDVPRSAEPASDARQDMQAASAPGWFETKKDANEAARSPVAWLLDEAGAPVSSGVAPGFLITGMNVSDETLTRVHGTLKPDSSQREFELALSVQANDVEGEAAIPAGARFSLGFPEHEQPETRRRDFYLQVHLCGAREGYDLVSHPLNDRAVCKSRLIAETLVRYGSEGGITAAAN